MDMIFPKKLAELEKALQTLESIVTDTDSPPVIKRDVMVMRFLYTSELFHKTLKIHLRENFEIESEYPADTYRKARNAGILNDEEAEKSLEMLKDRNFCAHAYQENVIQKIANNVPSYTKLIRKVCNCIKE